MQVHSVTKSTNWYLAPQKRSLALVVCLCPAGNRYSSSALLFCLQQTVAVTSITSGVTSITSGDTELSATKLNTDKGKIPWRYKVSRSSIFFRFSGMGSCLRHLHYPGLDKGSFINQILCKIYVIQKSLCNTSDFSEVKRMLVAKWRNIMQRSNRKGSILTVTSQHIK